MDLQVVIDYLLTDAVDPFPQYILRKEVLQETLSSAESEAIKTSKWYKQLVEEQSENGSWGRFHTQDTHELRKRKFLTSEGALIRARDLSLTKDDPMIHKAIGLMERYLIDKEKWSDVNKKEDGFITAFKTLVAANLSLFDPQNPLLLRKKELCAINLAKAFISEELNEEVWESENRKCNDILLAINAVYPIWLLQNNDLLTDDVQRKLLLWIWNRNDGIYYVSNFPLAELHSLEDKKFTGWLYVMENISNFSLFPEFLNKNIAGHLHNEIYRLMNEDVSLPPAAPMAGHYSEKWSNKKARTNDLILRILRILSKAKKSLVAV